MNAIAASREVVLVVDDSPATLGVLNEALEVAGYTVLVAQSGAAALALMQRVSPDIVLMDAVMPGLDGFETCRRMKTAEPMAAIPVVFMTGLTETEHVLRGLEAGGVDYVAKPVSPQEVVARVGVHLTTARLTRSARAALDTAGRFLLAVGRDGRVQWCTPQAARLVGAVAGAPVTTLPDEALSWLQSCLGQAGAKSDLTTKFTGDAGPVVRLSYLGQVGPDEVLLRVAPGHGEEASLSQALGLTFREAEVLLWLSRGKSNRDIATILGLSPRTVNKHLEQIFFKLRVENRASATAVAVKALQERS
jgi:DNA-binding NarL/FixJ family response regulator